MPTIAHTTCFEFKWTSFQKNRKLRRHLFMIVAIFPWRSWKTMYDGNSSSIEYLKNMASYYDWAFRWLQSLLALQIYSVSQKIHKNCEKNENFPSKSQKMTFWCGRKKWRGRWTVNNSFNSLGLKHKHDMVILKKIF